MKGLMKYLSPFAPDMSGAVSVLFGLKGILVIIDAGGCTGNVCGFDEPRWFQERGAVFSAGLRDLDAILGRDEKMLEKTADLLERMEAPFVAYIGTPVPAVIGTDFHALRRMAEKKFGIPVLTVDCNGMDLYDKGAEKAYLELVDEFLLPGVQGRFESENAKQGSTPKHSAVPKADLQMALAETRKSDVSRKMSGSPDVTNSGVPKNQMSGCLDVSNSGVLEDQVSGSPDVSNSGVKENRIFGNMESQNSGTLEDCAGTGKEEVSDNQEAQIRTLVFGVTPLDLLPGDTPEALRRRLGGESVHLVGESLQSLRAIETIRESVVIAPCGLAAAKRLKKEAGIPYRISYPLPEEWVIPDVGSGESVLILHQAVLAEEIGRRIRERVPDARVETATFFGKLKGEDAFPIHLLKEEHDFIELVHNGGYDRILADPLLERACRGFAGAFDALPHVAVSGNGDDV